MILAGIQTILPIVMNILNTLVPFISTAITTIWSIIQPILQAILALIQFLMPTILSIVKTAITAIGGVIKGIVTVIQGIINFITGVFTGNWKQAWEGVKQVFSGVFGGIKSIAKGVINGVIDILNIGIRAMNKLKIPKGIPVVGGKGINIPEIPQFAKGTPRTPRTFIAGEKGPELITNAPNMKVFTASETSNLMRSQKAATVTKAVTQNFAPATAAVQTQAPEVSKGAGRSTSYSVVVHNQPVIQIDGSKPDDLDEKLKKNNDDLLRKMDEKLDKREDDERRSRYE
jgi:hypothetical protein